LAWCIVSSPLILGHDLSDDVQYDAAWPIISNRAALAVNQAWNGADAGRLLNQSTEMQTNLTLYHGAGCECVWAGQSLPVWTVWAKALDANGTAAAALAINFSNETIPVGTIEATVADIFNQKKKHNQEAKVSGGNLRAAAGGEASGPGVS